MARTAKRLSPITLRVAGAGLNGFLGQQTLLRSFVGGTARQIEVAKKQLLAYRAKLTALGLDWKQAVVLTGRGWLGDDLEHILGSHAHIHVAEGEAIRSATRLALDAMGTVFIEQDEKSILPEASQQLNCSQQDCDSIMKRVKPAEAKSWRKEERLIALGAWLNRG